MTARKPPIPVRAGQIWADTYHGSKGRTVRVVETDYRHAIVEVVTNATGPGAANTVGRRNRVLYDDRGIRGYRLVANTGGSATPTARTAAEDRALLEHVATLRRVKVTFNEDEIWALYRLLVAELSTDTPCLLPELHKEHEFAMSAALTKVSDAHMDLTTPKEGEI